MAKKPQSALIMAGVGRRGCRVARCSEEVRELRRWSRSDSLRLGSFKKKRDRVVLSKRA